MDQISPLSMQSAWDLRGERKRHGLPIGTLTPTNLPFCRAGPVEGTKFPRMIPMAIARKIHRARYWSRIPRLLKAEVLVVVVESWGGCFSGSVEVEPSSRAVVVGGSVVFIAIWWDRGQVSQRRTGILGRDGRINRDAWWAFVGNQSPGLQKSHQ